MTRRLPLVLALLALGAPAVAEAKKPAKGDRDRDGIADAWEKKHKLPKGKKGKPTGDADGDGLNNLYEFLSKTNPKKGDSDRDKISDANEDSDRDKVDNRSEQQGKSDPGDSDSDNDGKKDGAEDTDRDGLDDQAEDVTGNDPRKKDTDGDGIKDGKEGAGVVKSVKGDVVTIKLATGGVRTATIGEDTDLSCRDEAKSSLPTPKAPKDSGDEDDLGEDGDDEGTEDLFESLPQEGEEILEEIVDEGEAPELPGDDADFDEEEELLEDDLEAEEDEDEADLGLPTATCVKELKAGIGVNQSSVEGSEFVHLALVSKD